MKGEATHTDLKGKRKKKLQIGGKRVSRLDA
jgi:hypothetical protein